MRRITSLRSYVLLLVILPLIIAFSYLHYFLNQSLSAKLQQYNVQGIDNKVTVLNDQNGVAYIDAKTPEDAFYAMGFVHAQSRLWQLELQKRMVQGRLSELFGRQSLEQDVWLRTLGLYESAKQSWQYLSPEAKNSLTAYSDGINAAIVRLKDLPLEFKLLGIEPSNWTVYDSLGWMKMFSLNLSNNYQFELLRLLAHNQLPKPQLKALFPAYPPDAPVTVADIKQPNIITELLAMSKRVEEKLSIGAPMTGSNAWVVSGNHSVSNFPVLANDPHMSLQQPSLWFTVNIMAGELSVTGMSLVGLPLVIFGKNKDISWGGTNLMADVQDIYIEKVDPHNRGQYWYNNQWQPFQIRKVVIDVRADFPSFMRTSYKPVEVDVRATVHGPVISDNLGYTEHVLSLGWTALNNKDRSYDALYQLNFANNWTSFLKSFEHYVSPTLNMLYADKEGNIGYTAIGKIPIRNKGNGYVPVPGWENEYYWRDNIPLAEMPQSFNPESGIIVSANNKVVSKTYPYFISDDWAPPARAQRIEQQLRKIIASNNTITVEEHKKLQLDTVDLSAKRLAKQMASIEGTTSMQKDMVEQLRNWDGNMSSDSIAATVFHVWFSSLSELLFNDSLSANWSDRKQTSQLRRYTSFAPTDVVYNALVKHPQLWCSNFARVDSPKCHEELYKSLEIAAQKMQKHYGSDTKDWSWGEVGKVLYSHIPFSGTKVLDKFFERTTPLHGSRDSISVNAPNMEQDGTFTSTFGASFRQIISWQKNEAHLLFSNSTGQSGNVIDSHYDDMVNSFYQGEFFQLTPTLSSPHKRLELFPEPLK